MSRAIPTAIRDQVFSRDGDKCKICGVGGRIELHHIVPFIFGGRHTPENLITLCKSCHRCVETKHVGINCRARMWRMGKTVEWFYLRCHELGLVLPANQHQTIPYYHKRVLEGIVYEEATQQ